MAFICCKTVSFSCTIGTTAHTDTSLTKKVRVHYTTRPATEPHLKTTDLSQPTNQPTMYKNPKTRAMKYLKASLSIRPCFAFRPDLIASALTLFIPLTAQCTELFLRKQPLIGQCTELFLCKRPLLPNDQPSRLHNRPQGRQGYRSLYQTGPNRNMERGPGRKQTKHN